MTKILGTLVIFLLSRELAIAQTFKVSEVRRCSYSDGRHVKKGDILSLESKFTLSRNGQIQMEYLDQWSFSRSSPGNYAMDTIYSNLKRLKNFKIIDTIYQVLKTNGVLNCQFSYKYTSKSKKLADGSVVTWSDIDNIKIKNDQRTKAADSIALIEWDYPINYSGKYFILFTDMFDGYIDLLTTSNKSINLDVKKYRENYETIRYKIISEECRESDNAHILVLR